MIFIMFMTDLDYNIPRKIRELQYVGSGKLFDCYYNIPRKIRELQCSAVWGYNPSDYNIPRKIRELQFFVSKAEYIIIITYQEKLGNYNLSDGLNYKFSIITYQEKLGNYNYSI